MQLTLRPGRAGAGILFFQRPAPRHGGSARAADRDRPGAVEIPARPARVSSTSNATTIARETASVSTVEHLMAALHAMQIDNVEVEVEGPEVPVMDGSAAPFTRLLRRAGVFEQSTLRPHLEIARPVEVVDGPRRISIEPARSFRVSYVVDFDHPAIGRQAFEVPRLTPDFFERELAPARTFGFLQEVSELWRNGLARGGSLDNTVVLDDRRVMNPDGLRWPDEFVRHKVLDLIGDLALMGLPIRGHVQVERGGHSLHHRLVRALLDSPDAYRVCDAADSFGTLPRRVLATPPAL